MQAGKLEEKMGEPMQEVLGGQQECEQAADDHGGLAGAAGQHLASGSALWFQVWESCGRGEGAWE